MAENEDLSELLFFDTFSHEVDMDINLDLVQFPKPVYITQVRIIPLGARVQADFPGGVRLGATNPSKFGIEFFVNDLGMPGASTFENLGHLEYNQNDCIHLECSQEKIPTDGLVLRGWYSTITLAVYGVLTNTVAEQIASPPPPAPIDPATSEDVCSDGTNANANALPVVTLPPNEPEKEDWKEPILNEPSHAQKTNTGEYIERDDLEYTMSSREASAIYYHSEDERDRSSSRNRTHSESNERDYIRSRSERERERDRERGGEKSREWSRSPDYSRRSRRKRSERSRSYVEDSAQKWPRTPPALMDSPGRPRSPDGLEYDDSDDLIVTSGHYKIKSRSYLPASSESLTSPAGQPNQDLSMLNDDDETPGTPGEQFEPILSDDELVGGNYDSNEQAPAPDEYEMEIDIAARSASPAIHEFDPYKMPLQKFECDLNSFYSKDIENLTTIFAKFGEQTKVSSLEKYTASSTGVDDRETFVFLCEQLINQLGFLSQSYKRRNFVLGKFFKQNESNLEQAFNIIKIALDFDGACLQTQPAFKIRHIKIGARLIELLGGSIEFMDYLLLTQKFDPFSAVFSLYQQEFMAMSIKLMLLKSIYALLDTKLGIQTLLNSKINGYHWLLQHIQQTSLTRTKYAIKSILKKLHLIESLECIHENCSKLFMLKKFDESNESFRLIELSIVQVMDALVGNVLSFQQPRRFLPVSKKFEVVVDNNAQRSYINMLQSYLKMYSLGECLLLLLINLRDLPSTLLMYAMDLLQVLIQTQVGIDYFVDDCFETTQLLVAALLGNVNEVPIEEEEKPLQGTIAENNMVVIKKEREEQYKVDDNNLESIATENNSGVEQNVIGKAATIVPTTSSTEGKNSSENLSKLTGSPELASENRESKQDSENFNKTFEPALVKPLTLNRLQRLGIELAYKIQTRYHLDAIIFAASTAVSEYDAIKLATHLHALYSQTCNPAGRQHTVQFIGSNNNLQIFMDLIKKEQRLQAQQQSKAPGSKYKSPVLSYAVDMLDCCVRYCENLDYLVEHGAKILELAKNHDTFEPSVSAVLQEMFVYLRPLEVINIFAYDDVGPLVEVITRSLEYITTFPGDLIMGLRILHYLVIGRSITTKQYETYSQIAVHGTVTSVADTEELRHRFVLLQFYAADGVQILIQILERLCYYFDQPGLHAPALVTIQGTHCCQIVLPTLQILGEMLAFAIQCRDVAFKDVTAIDHLMKTYYLMHYFPNDSPSEPEATLAKKEIVNILLSYTQPNEQGEEYLHKSLWTQMIREVLKNIVNGPSTYIPGLKVLAELLPLPLPLPTLTPLSPEQTQRLITERKLWSAHLHPQSSQIAKLIETIIPSSFPQLSNLLARVCLQLADLAPNMTLLISKTITDLICAEWVTSGNKPTQHLARVLSFFSQIVMYPSVKSSALSILSGKVWDLFQTILCTPSAELTEVHFKCQLFIQRCLESFMDSEISLMSPQCTKNAEVNLASALPPKELIPKVAEAVLTNLLRVELTDEVSALAARNLVIMTEHDITFYHLVQQLRQKRSDFQLWLQTLVTSLEIGDYNSLIEIILLLMRSLLHVEEEPPSISLGFNIPPRTLKLTPNELAYIIGFKKDSKDSDSVNLLQQLTKSLEQQKSKINLPSSVFIDINTLITQLQTVDTNSPIESDEDSVSVSASSWEPQLPQTEGIVTQYSTRPMFTTYKSGSDAIQLCSKFWLDPLCIDTLSKKDLEVQCSRTACDLIELTSSCLSADTNLSADCKRLLHLSASPQSNRERTPTAPCFRTRRVEVEPSTGRPEKKIYITPVRGRGGGFSRAPPSRGDLFRSRPPNTSRPPSLHVDDFLALETCGAQPTGPTGYNKIPSIMRGSRIGRNRGLRISTVGSYRKPKPLRTSSPSTWNDSVSSTHYRSTTAPDAVGSHFSADAHYSIGSSSHFSSRSRGRGGRLRSYLR